MYLRVVFARNLAPKDIFTVIARWIVTRLVTAIAWVLAPVDRVLQMIGRGFLRVFEIFGLMGLLFLTAIWFFPFWCFIMGTSRLWLAFPWMRPILIIPGIIGAVLAAIYLMLVPDFKKEPDYITFMHEWPLSWAIWKPSEEFHNRNVTAGGHAGTQPQPAEPRKFEPNA